MCLESVDLILLGVQVENRKGKEATICFYFVIAEKCGGSVWAGITTWERAKFLQASWRGIVAAILEIRILGYQHWVQFSAEQFKK